MITSRGISKPGSRLSILAGISFLRLSDGYTRIAPRPCIWRACPPRLELDLQRAPSKAALLDGRIRDLRGFGAPYWFRGNRRPSLLTRSSDFSPEFEQFPS